MRTPSRTISRTAPLSLLFLIVACGCGATPGTPPRPPDTGPGRPPISADPSLTPEEYLKAGVPAWEKPWSAEDMAAAARALSAVAEKDPRSLPRYQSERSGPLFARITAADNLDRFKDPSLPLDQRFPQSNDFL